MDSNFAGPVNIGSEEMVTINQLVNMAAEIAGPTGVRGRNSDNRLIREKLGWAPERPLVEGLEKTFQWIDAQVNTKAIAAAS